MGFVARNYLGDFLGSASIPFDGFMSPHFTEALAFREALVVATNHGFSNTIVEGATSGTSIN